MEYTKITETILNQLRAIVGADNVMTDADQMQLYAHDEVTVDDIYECIG